MMNAKPNYWLPPHTPHKLIFSPVVGSAFGYRQQVVVSLHYQEDLWLRREPDNPHDENAIRVERGDGALIGYLPHLLAAHCAPLFDAYGAPVPAWVVSFHGTARTLKVRIGFMPPEPR